MSIGLLSRGSQVRVLPARYVADGSHSARESCTPHLHVLVDEDRIAVRIDQHEARGPCAALVGLGRELASPRFRTAWQPRSGSRAPSTSSSRARLALPHVAPAQRLWPPPTSPRARSKTVALRTRHGALRSPRTSPWRRREGSLWITILPGTHVFSLLIHSEASPRHRETLPGVRACPTKSHPSIQGCRTCRSTRG